MQKWVHTPALKDSDHKRRNERCRLQNADQRVTDVAPVLSCRSLNGTPCMVSKCMSKSPSFHDRPTKAGLECIVGQHTSGRCIPLATWHRAIRSHASCKHEIEIAQRPTSWARRHWNDSPLSGIWPAWNPRREQDLVNQPPLKRALEPLVRAINNQKGPFTPEPIRVPAGCGVSSTCCVLQVAHTLRPLLRACSCCLLSLRSTGVSLAWSTRLRAASVAGAAAWEGWPRSPDGAFSLIGFGSDPQAAAQDHHLCLDLQQLTEQCSRKALSQISVHRQIFWTGIDPNL